MSFIVFEGSDGVGKSTIVREVAALLHRAGKKVRTTAEPWGLPFREVLSHVTTERAKALVHAAARAEHLSHCVTPYLDNGYIVLCDRYTPSSFVYQGMLGGLGCDEIQLYNQFFPKPDRVFLLSCNPRVARERIVARGDARPETIDEILRIQDAYREWNYAWNDCQASLILTENPAGDAAERITKEILG